MPVWCLYLKLLPISLQYSEFCTFRLISWQMIPTISVPMRSLCSGVFLTAPPRELAEFGVIQKLLTWRRKQKPKETPQADVMGPSMAKNVLKKRRCCPARCHKVMSYFLGKARHCCSQKSSLSLNLCHPSQWLPQAFALAFGQPWPRQCIALEQLIPALLPETSTWSSTRRDCQQTKGFSSMSH